MVEGSNTIQKQSIDILAEPTKQKKEKKKIKKYEIQPNMHNMPSKKM